ncbi:LPXTG cell wall anchor domain-containing protein [Enterococcus rivorum]|uniref:Gram-positive cocci surface proteins LPxTG domain-containing protein n=1 Tax=Enterococcus rivorum TaxID=762845 RepID=A0A1E5KY41_9ENTE|nr:LPXTG cell wall anchor domain-containing protein [Enterococcus rivorum]MBP2099970.1 LPXTG-motif cell wall-anchored protein [Enterococcus rivorum]OEH82820.1 hypothetical protein BCR26_11365 [Enterococcus rivorum]
MKKKGYLFAVCLIAYFSLASMTVTKAAEGGQVDNRIGITFEEPSQSTDVSSSSSSSTPEASSESSSSAIPSEKPRGKLPKAGELLGNYGFIGLALFLLFLILFVIKKRKGEQ